MAHPKVIVNLYPVLPARDDAVGAVRRVSVVPAPYQPPHPPVFTAVSASMESIEFCAERAIAPVYFSSMSSIVNMAQHYVTDGRVQGRDCQLGEPQCTVRWPHFTRDLADTRRILAAQDEEFYKNIYGTNGTYLSLVIASSLTGPEGPKSDGE